MDLQLLGALARVAETGAVGASIEDYAAAYGTGDLYDRVLAVERIEAAATTAASLPVPFSLTARAECYLVGHPIPFGESVARATSYREAGSDCLYVPGIADAETIGRLVKEVGAPVNVVMGLAGSPMSVNQLEDLIEVTTDGRVVVADPGNDRLQVLDADLGFVRTIGGPELQFDEPKYFTIDSRGRIYLADEYNDRIVIPDQDYRSQGVLGAGPSGTDPGELDHPEGAEVAGEHLWVADTGNNRIVLYRLVRV